MFDIKNAKDRLSLKLTKIRNRAEKVEFVTLANGQRVKMITPGPKNPWF